MKLSNFNVGGVGDLVTRSRFGWVTVNISFEDEETSAYPSVQFQVPIQYDRKSNISDVREAAFNKAKKVLSATTHELQTKSFIELEKFGDDQEP